MQYVGEKFIKVINFLKDTYVSVDLRGVFAFAKQENQWRCAFLKIRFSDQERDALDSIYEEKYAKLGKIDKSNFKIILENRSITKFDQIIDELDDMHFHIGDIVAQPMGTQWQNIKWPNENVAVNPTGFISEKEANGYPHIVYFSRARSIEDVVRHHCNIDIGNYGIDFPDLKSYLDISKIDNDIDLAVCFPIPCKEKSIPKSERKDKLFRFQVHQISLMIQASWQNYSETMNLCTNMNHH